MPGDERSTEHQRVEAADARQAGWRDWGPYVAERAWGTVREDYSADGDAWRFFPYDHARSRTYRWNEDGMAGFCDLDQTWVLALALWNGQDDHLKERMFGLAGPEGNHGEDAKDYWWYLDGTPTHSWQRWRYHYPQARFPYDELRAENARRGVLDPEYELADTGVFDDGRYWVVTADYAKAGPHDLLLRLTVENAGPETAKIDVLPTLWFRNTWSWDVPEGEKPAITQGDGALIAGPLTLAYETADASAALFCDNETNAVKLFGEGATNRSAYPKDAINDFVVNGAWSVNPQKTGTKASVRYTLTVAPGESRVLRLRLAHSGDDPVGRRAPDADRAVLDRERHPFADFDEVMAAREAEADAFHDAVAPTDLDADRKRVLRQSLAGLTWSKQFFHYDVRRWLAGDPAYAAPPPGRGNIRNGGWQHLAAKDVILMPDAWEYPWFAAWDLAFHCMTYAHIDPGFAKSQLVLLLREWYTHASGQLPAYEWDFGDVNPPTQAHAALVVFRLDGGTDYTFLARVFHKLLINFTWWTNTKDAGQNDLFEGGFMGLDNIAPVNRSTLPPDAGRIEQADSTAWMAVYALDLLEMALTLAHHDPAYEDVAVKFFEHFTRIADAANDEGLWSDDDAFYYDVLTLPDGTKQSLRVRSLVGLVPVTASLTLDGLADGLPEFQASVRAFIRRQPEAADNLHLHPRGGGTTLLALVSPERLTRVLAKVFDEQGMLSPHGIRSISAWHREHPFHISVGGTEQQVDYEPGESTSHLFGGNSNWRGPVWFPLNALIIGSLRDYEGNLGEAHTVEYPAGSGVQRGLGEIADDLADRLISLFTPGAGGGPRASDARYPLLSQDPRWRDQLFFYEYFHGDTGQGLGASHQTGWTALVARLILKESR
ncbi:MGH1-like glycoside hydrolase domain-containing protein [Gryllotalpicola protaetiae]|uniref:Glucosidase n=1 Tax=Gryllotalpicola protaetiae TaxID=2419771 RepID=A0A387BKM1_9MICO|nr:glucosidase [Gryllotalpicola protaetiae]AYG02714.1 glucosidase [Gryllotalpicola protaetiae]